MDLYAPWYNYRCHPQYVGMLGLREGPDGLRGSGPIVPLMEMITLSLKTWWVFLSASLNFLDDSRAVL